MKFGTNRPVLSAVAAALLLAFSLPAHAFFTSQTAGPATSRSDATTITFGDSIPTNAGPIFSNLSPYTEAGIDFTGGAIYNINPTPIDGITARPVGSVGNFWSVGPDPSAQNGPGVVTFGTGLDYYGFLWGSPDTYNTVTYFDGNQVLGSFTGDVVLHPANGNQNFAAYFNAFVGPGEKITSVTFASTQNAFETDNHAISAVPEPESYAMLLAGLSLLGFMARRRKRQSTAA